MGFNKGKFGSSLARAKWRLKRVMMSFWVLLACVGISFTITLGSPVWLTPLLYLMGLVTFHAWHWMAHQRWLLYPAYKVHMFHHWKVYPPKRFLSKVYTNDKAGRTYWSSFCHDAPLYSGMALNVYLLWKLGMIDRWQEIVVAGATYAGVGSWSNWLHHTFHIEGHWIERYVYFHDLRALHYTHHQGTAKHNYGFMDFGMDMADGSLAKPDYGLSNRKKDTQSGSAHAKLLRSPSTKGDEHISIVEPGPLPTLFGDGLKECTFAIVAYLIEKIVGLLGTIMGKVLDDQKNDVDGSLPHKKGDIKMLEMEGIWNFCATVFEMA